MTNTVFHLPLSEAHILAIGNVTAHFSLLEHDANILISDLLGLQSREDTIAITAHMMFSTKLQLLKTLASTRFEDNEELGDSLRDVIEDMEQINTKRNTIVHAQWYYYSPSSNESGVMRHTARGKIKTSLEGFTPEDIMNVTNSIIAATSKVQQFLLAKNGALYFG